MTRSNFLARNVLVSVANQLVTWVLSFWVTVMMPQHLGADGFGEFSLAFAVAGLCSMTITLGTSTVIIREVARDHARAASLLPTALALRIPLTLVAVAVAGGASSAMHYAHSVIVLIVLAEVGMGLASLNDAFCSVLQGMEQIPKQNVLIFFERLIYSSGTIVLLLMRAPIWTLVAITLVSNLCELIVASAIIRPHVRRLEIPTIRSMGALLRDGLPFATTSLFSSLYSQCDPPILKKYSAMSVVGWYSLGRRLLGAVLFLPVALTSALLPTLARLSREDPDAYASLIRRMIDLVLIAVVPFAALLIFGSRQILAMLHYPPDFAGSIPVLAIFGAGFVAWYLSQVVGTGLVASDKQKELSRITGIAALGSLPLCIAMVVVWQARFHNGAVGAALSDVVVEVGLLVCYLHASRQRLMGLGSLATFGKALIAGVPLIAALYATRSGAGTGTVVISCAAGALAYVPLCLLLRCIQPADMKLLRAAVERRRSNANEEASDYEVGPVAGETALGAPNLP